MESAFFAFVGAKGGAGTSTLCVELAKTMRDQNNVTLVDADFSGRRSLAILLDGVRYLDAAREQTTGHIARARLNGTTLVELSESYEAGFTARLQDIEALAAALNKPGAVLVDLPLPFAANARPFVVRTTRFVVVVEPTIQGAQVRQSFAVQRLARPPRGVARRSRASLCSRPCRSGNAHPCQRRRSGTHRLGRDAPGAPRRSGRRATHAKPARGSERARERC